MPGGQPACLPAIRPGCARCMALEFLHSKGNYIRFTKLLFQRMFICRVTVLPFILYYVVSFCLQTTLRNMQIGVDKLVGKVLINLLHLLV